MMNPDFFSTADRSGFVALRALYDKEDERRSLATVVGLQGEFSDAVGQQIMSKPNCPDSQASELSLERKEHVRGLSSV